MKYEELIGKYLNGFFITKVEKDPFIKGQINLWTDSTKEDFLGNREVVKFYVRDYPSGATIYQEQVDKKIERLCSLFDDIEDLCKMYNNLPDRSARILEFDEIFALLCNKIREYKREVK